MSARYATVGRYAPAAERFMAKVDRDGPINEHRPDLGPCWIWTGATGNHGYGSLRGDDGKTVLAHRFSYELQIGPIPVGLQIDHLCRVRACVNPLHLEPVTPIENVARGLSPAAVLHREGVCSRGHALVGPDADVYIRKGGKPMCRRCRRERRAAA